MCSPRGFKQLPFLTITACPSSAAEYVLWVAHLKSSLKPSGTTVSPPANLCAYHSPYLLCIKLYKSERSLALRPSRGPSHLSKLRGIPAASKRRSSRQSSPAKGAPDALPRGHRTLSVSTSRRRLVIQAVSDNLLKAQDLARHHQASLDFSAPPANCAARVDAIMSAAPAHPVAPQRSPRRTHAKRAPHSGSAV